MAAASIAFAVAGYRRAAFISQTTSKRDGDENPDRDADRRLQPARPRPSSAGRERPPITIATPAIAENSFTPTRLSQSNAGRGTARRRRRWRRSWRPRHKWRRRWPARRRGRRPDAARRRWRAGGGGGAGGARAAAERGARRATGGAAGRAERRALPGTAAGCRPHGPARAQTALRAEARAAQTAPARATAASRAHAARRSPSPATRPRAEASRAAPGSCAPTPRPRSAARTGRRAGSARRTESPPFLFYPAIAARRPPRRRVSVVAGVQPSYTEPTALVSFTLIGRRAGRVGVVKNREKGCQAVSMPGSGAKSVGSEPIVIGVAGGSGSGKTTVVRHDCRQPRTRAGHRARARPLLPRPQRSAARGARGAQLRPPGLARDRPAGRATCTSCGPAGRSSCRSTTSRASSARRRARRSSRAAPSSSKAS